MPPEEPQPWHSTPPKSNESKRASIPHRYARTAFRLAAIPSRGTLEVEKQAIFPRSWQYVCHIEKLRHPGDYVAFEILGHPLFAVRDGEGALRAFYNVCQHRAHALVQGCSNEPRLVCPYHAWTYDLSGQLMRARHTERLENFDTAAIHLKGVAIEKFCNLVFCNLDAAAAPLGAQSGRLGEEIREWAPDLDALTHAHRITYTIRSNWKNVVDNFLECYHCPVAHKDFVDMVEMDTYRVTTHAIYSSHMARAGTKEDNSAYSAEGADVKDHAVWWLWPNICLLRYPGAGNLMVLNVVPVDTTTTLETYDFYFLEDKPSERQWAAIEYVDKVLQREDIDIVESVQRGMQTPAFEHGRIVADPSGSGLSEHGVHHFHGLVLDAYRGYLGNS